MDNASDSVDLSVQQGGSYELLRKRLSTQGQILATRVGRFNLTRQKEFGASGSELVGKANVLTQARCLPVDMAQVDDLLLFGYQVFVGLKSTPAVEDVLGLYRLGEVDGGYRVDPVPLAGTFLEDPRFVQSFKELFTYYKDAKLSQISRRGQLVYLAFRIGERPDDLKVYRWQIAKGRVDYLDDQGRLELSEAVQQDIQWRSTTREDLVTGTFPHVSVMDRVFVECTHGDLTIKVEDNTETGRGIYSEPVDDSHQTVNDAEIAYARAGGLILLRVLPNREKIHRHLVFNPITEQVTRADSLGRACKLLPEGHGIIFPNGYALTTGEVKQFPDESPHSRFFHTFSAPNGEDVLYCFFDPGHGAYLMYGYNLIEKRFAPPLHSHGYSFLNDGRMLLFRLSDNAEASTIHPLRVWRTPFMTPDHYAAQERTGGLTFFRNIGNAELVRAISELNSIVQLTASDDVSRTLYETLIEHCRNTLDSYHWLGEPEALDIEAAVTELALSADRIIDEFAKARSMGRQAQERLARHADAQQDLVTRIKLTGDQDAGALIGLLAEVKASLGRAISLREQRYMDLGRLTGLEGQLEQVRGELNHRLLRLLQEEKAYADFHRRLDALGESLAARDKAAELVALTKDAEEIRSRLFLVNEEVAEIESDDPTQTTRILDLTANVIARLNGLDARLRQRLDALRSREAEAEFASQFKLLAQTVTSALGQAGTPDQADEQLARIMGLVERLETRFADFDGFLAEIYAKRDEIQSGFESHKQQLLAARQRRIENIAGAAEITLKSIAKRVEKFEHLDALNSFFAADTMVAKLRRLADDIRGLADPVRADGFAGRLKALQDQSLRALRDNKDMFEQGGTVLRLGRHRFSVQGQDLDLTLVTRDDALTLHLTGTDFYARVEDPELLALRQFADMDLVSESPRVYRGEYLAYSVLGAAESGKEDLSLAVLDRALDDGGLLELIGRFAAPRFREGYLKGVHDRDAALLLGELLPVYRNAGLLRFGQQARARGLLWLATLGREALDRWSDRCRHALQLRRELGAISAMEQAALAVQRALLEDDSERDMGPDAAEGRVAGGVLEESANYLVELLGQESRLIHVGREARETAASYLALRRGLGWRAAEQPPRTAFADHLLWLQAYTQRHGGGAFATEAALVATLRGHPILKLTPADFPLGIRLEGLLGQHPRIDGGTLELTLDDFLARCRHQAEQVAPSYLRYLAKRRELTTRMREELRLDELRPRPLTTFVRNRLISESYLPLIGDNLAKQIGALGAARRTDQMGMLLLISPPGYGKTTLIEYLAGKIGMVFVKVNCPSIGHQVTSLDPEQAPSSTSRREVEKLNLALELGNNVLLYLDDIQHTSPEFLQKFISVSDATRRIEGVWRGRARTYDMRGRRFALVMAGNPYTESGETFRIPDMLANRADVYNLGDMLSDQKDAFELSYIENSLTSNPVLAPLATRDLDDVYRFVRLARGEAVALSDMSQDYAEAQASEIVEVLERLLQVQQVVLKVNQAYIASAAVADPYRTEPPFKLQGSYRDMNKLAEQVVAVMTDQELTRLIRDHYQGEAQTLAAGAEENLLKLGELLNGLDEQQQTRWEEVKEIYRRERDLGAKEDRGAQMVGQLDKVNRNLRVVAYSLYQHLKITRGDEKVGDEDRAGIEPPEPPE